MRLHRGVADDEVRGAGLLVDLALFGLPDRPPSLVTGVYLAVSYGCLGLAMIRQSADLELRITSPRAGGEPVGW